MVNADGLAQPEYFTQPGLYQVLRFTVISEISKYSPVAFIDLEYALSQQFVDWLDKCGKINSSKN